MTMEVVVVEVVMVMVLVLEETTVAAVISGSVALHCNNLKF